MSQPNGWKRIVVPLALAGMILVLAYIVVVFVTTLQQSRAGLSTVHVLETRVTEQDACVTAVVVEVENVAKSAEEAAEAQAAAVQTVEARAKGLEDRAGDAEAQIEDLSTRLSAVEATPTDTPVPEPTESPAPTEHPTVGGLGLTYRIPSEEPENPDAHGAALYQVDEVFAYLTYGDFVRDWLQQGRLEGPAVVQMALIRTSADPETWTLYHAPFADAEVQPDHWYYYTLSAGQDDCLEAPSVTLEHAPPATIADTQTITVDPGSTTIESLDALFVQGIPIDQGKANLLLADCSSGTPVYTLVVLDESVTSGWDPVRYFCTQCLGCGWICR
jgi:hypothetical protein